MSTYDDSTIIRKFVKNQVTENELVYNANLFIQNTNGISQLLGRDKKLIAWIKGVNNNRSALVNQNSKYWKLLHEAFQENSFIPIGSSEREGVIKYEQYDVPQGYKVNYTQAIDLWKTWYPRFRRGKPTGIQIEILILVKRRWASVREISIEQGTIYINTFFDKVFLSSTDKIVWLLKTAPITNQNSRQVEIEQSPPQAEVKQYSIIDCDQNLALENERRESEMRAKYNSVNQANHQRQVNRHDQAATPAIDLHNVIKFSQGRLHIHTAVGEIIVEGSDLSFRVNRQDAEK